MSDYYPQKLVGLSSIRSLGPAHAYMPPAPRFSAATAPLTPDTSTARWPGISPDHL